MDTSIGKLGVTSQMVELGEEGPSPPAKAEESSPRSNPPSPSRLKADTEANEEDDDEDKEENEKIGDFEPGQDDEVRSMVASCILGLPSESSVRSKRLLSAGSSSSRLTDDEQLQSVGFVGLVNQAMTCYLNSLLQALFMTPEFRNALYNWEFDGKDAVHSIPYQLQKLFLQLQTSSRSAIETTELTRSFGWDSGEAWHQHDVQELCRVMFDALEQKFKKTDQADLIKRLYEGKMIDYVKCLECGTEKSREDAFLDIPLPVRPFGGTVAFGSVEEALNAFVQPETLDGNNQYFCEKCDKKCDAHKGLKFSKFPYLLTLHLKRFDFDYTTMHRIKLNDRVAFPDTLKLDSFVCSDFKDEVIENDEQVLKCDDSSTTDSGSILGDESCQTAYTSTSSSSNDHNSDYCADEDEGIDVSSTGTSAPQENGDARKDEEAKNGANGGTYVYELFAIMIHSGSASGGHYYAYIKDFRQNKWFCFNDQSVSKISSEDITKSYGGGPTRGCFYSGAYSSSTNAYMLMYRQIDLERNVDPITEDQFPPHLEALARTCRDNEELRRSMAIHQKAESKRRSLTYYWADSSKAQQMFKVVVRSTDTLSELTARVAGDCGIKDLENVRLVTFNRALQFIERSFEGQENESMLSIMQTHTNDSWLLQTKEPYEEFTVYPFNSSANNSSSSSTNGTKVYHVDLDNETMFGPVHVDMIGSRTWAEYKAEVAKHFNLNPTEIEVVMVGLNNAVVFLEEDVATPMLNMGLCCRMFVANCSAKEDREKAAKFCRLVERFSFVVAVHVVLPANVKSFIDETSVPAIDVNQNNGKEQQQNHQQQVVSCDRVWHSLPKVQMSSPAAAGEAEEASSAVNSDQSNSEDSSLSDSDRTLVGDAPQECMAQLSSNSDSPAGSDHRISSPEDQDPIIGDLWDDDLPPPPPPGSTTGADTCSSSTTTATTTTATTYTCEITANPNGSGGSVKALVDRRISLDHLKKSLEPFVGVPSAYFKVYWLFSGQEVELTKPVEPLMSMWNGGTIHVVLERVLRPNEMLGKIYRLELDAADPATYLCEWVIARGETVAHAKKHLLEHIRRQGLLDVPPERCRFRKKSWKSSGKVYLDEQKFCEDIKIYQNWEIYLQVLPGDEPVTSPDQMALFVRRWRPSTMELDPLQEVVLDEESTEELKTKISAISSIPVEFLEMSTGRGNFPYADLASLKALLSKGAPDLWEVYLEDGHVVIYRDTRESSKQPASTEEKKEIANKESSFRVVRLDMKYSSSPRKERALKIYVDSPPNKSDQSEPD